MMVDPSHARAEAARLLGARTIDEAALAELHARARQAGDIVAEGHYARQLDRLPRPTWQDEAADALADADRARHRRSLSADPGVAGAPESEGTTDG